MEIKRGLTGVSQSADIQIQKGISKLLILKSGTTTAIGNEIITIVVKGGGSDVVIANRMKIRDLALLTQFQKGYMLQQADADAKISNAFAIDLGRGYNLNLSTNEYLSVSLETLQSTATYDIFGIEANATAREVIKYQSDFLPAGDPTSKVYPLRSNSVLLAIKNNSGLNKVTLVANNGNQVNYTPEELAFISRELNGMTIGPDSLVEGDSINQAISGSSGDFYFMPTNEFKSFELHTNNGVQVSFITTSLFTY